MVRELGGPGRTRLRAGRRAERAVRLTAVAVILCGAGTAAWLLPSVLPGPRAPRFGRRPGPARGAAGRGSRLAVSSLICSQNLPRSTDSSTLKACVRLGGVSRKAEPREDHKALVGLLCVSRPSPPPPPARDSSGGGARARLLLFTCMDWNKVYWSILLGHRCSRRDSPCTCCGGAGADCDASLVLCACKQCAHILARVG
jgi:hypothetical protein